jgi:hypothetical protein
MHREGKAKHLLVHGKKRRRSYQIWSQGFRILLVHEHKRRRSLIEEEIHPLEEGRMFLFSLYVQFVGALEPVEVEKPSVQRACEGQGVGYSLEVYIYIYMPISFWNVKKYIYILKR